MFELFLSLAWYQMIGMFAFPILFLIFVFNDEVIPYMDKKHLVNLNILVDLSKIDLDNKNKKYLI